MWAVRMGSYSMDFTMAGMLYLFRLKSMMRMRFLCPPPLWRMVILPVLFLPPVRFVGSRSAFSGLVLVRLLNTGAILKRCPDVRGLSFFTGMVYGMVAGYMGLGVC